MAYESWERQPRETPRAYALFSQYRDMGPLERSYVRVARDFGRSVSVIKKIAERNNWQPRVIAWDEENERTKRTAQVKEIEGMARRQVLAGQLFMSKGLKRVQAMTDEEVSMLSVWEAVRLVEAGVRLERLGRGETDGTNINLVQQNTMLVAQSSDTPLIELLRRNPTRVGPVVELLSAIQQSIPELASPGVVYDGVPLEEDEDMSEFFEESQEESPTDE